MEQKRTNGPAGRLRAVATGLLLTAALGAMLCSCGSESQPTTWPAAVQPTTAEAEPLGVEWRALFDGKTLAGWKVPDFDGAGKVYVKDGAVHMTAGDGCTGFTYTGPVPREEYEVELEGMRVKGEDFFCGLTFPVGKDPMTLVCSGWGGNVTGLSSLEGMDAANNETGTFLEYENNRWYKIRVRVTKKTIRAYRDDKEIITLEREGRKIGIRYEVEPSVPLGVTTWQTHGAARNIRIRLLAIWEE